MHFLSPVWLLGLLFVAALVGGYVWAQLRRTKHVVRFSNVALLATVAGRSPSWRRHLAFGLAVTALAIMVLGSAQPTSAIRVPRNRATVMLAIDVSPSMEATDVKPTRLLASEAGARLFVKLLPPGINLGLLTFGGVATVDVAPTTNRAAVVTAIDNIVEVDQTAIGEAVFSCLDAISVFSKTITAQGSTPAPARIVLLSDGFNNRGRSVPDAAAAAKAAHVPVSTIAFGTDDGTVDIQGELIPVPADKTALRMLAETTGGSYHPAASASDLRSVYQNLNSQIGYTTSHRPQPRLYLGIGFLLLLSAAACSVAWAERVL